MPKLSEKGIAHILVVLILLAGIIGGVYLVKNPAIFKPKADEVEIGVDYATWVSQMQAMGIYPAKDENGDIIFYDKKTYVEKFCVPQGCYLQDEAYEEILSRAYSKGNDFIGLLAEKLYKEGYAPFETLQTYFPDLTEKQLGGIYPTSSQGNYNTEIDQSTLTRYIRQIETELDPNYKSIFDIWVDNLDPILGTRAMVNWLTLPPNKVSDEERLSAIFGFTIIYGLTEKVTAKGVKLTAEATIDLAKMIQEAAPFRKQILAREPIAFDVLGNLAPSWFIKKAGPAKPNSVVVRAEAWSSKSHILPQSQFQPGTFVSRSGSVPVPKNTRTLQRFNSDIKPALEAGRGALISRTDVLRPVADNVKRAITDFEARTGRRLLTSTDELVFNRAVEDGTMYAVEDAFLNGIGAGYTTGDMIVMGYGRYFSERGIGSMHHEMVHMLGGGSKRAVGWIYGGPYERDKVLTTIFELMTDAWADVAMGQRIMSQGSHLATGGYARSNPHIIDALYNRLFKFNPQLEDDFLEFAITGDADQLVAKFGGFEQFLAHFRQRGINFNAAFYSAPAVALFNQLKEDGSEEGETEGVISVDPIIDIEEDFIQDIPEE